MRGQNLGNRSRKCTENAGERALDCQFMFQTLHATSQDGLSLEFVAATTGKEWNIQDARGGGLCTALTNEKRERLHRYCSATVPLHTAKKVQWNCTSATILQCHCTIVHCTYSAVPPVMREYHKMNPNKDTIMFGFYIIYRTNIWIYLDATYLSNKYQNICRVGIWQKYKYK